MTRWEYNELHFTWLPQEGYTAIIDGVPVVGITQCLNRFGAAGWELVSLLVKMPGTRVDQVAVFKRPLR